MSASTIPAGLLARLDLAVLERLPDGTFQLLGAPPSWLRTLWPQAVKAGQDLEPGETFIFLEHFLGEAEAFWAHARDASLASGPWTEVGADGRTWVLEATALRIDGRALLLINFPTTDYQSVRRILQESREQSLEHYQLIKEINKREVLLHCIVHDLSTPLAGIKGSMMLLDDDNLVDPAGERLLQIGLNQVEKMQRLIREILTTFANEVRPLLPTLVKEDTAPDVLVSVREAVASMEAVAALRGVAFRIAAAPEEGWKVIAEQARLERVFFNLIENALRHAPSGTEIVVRIENRKGQVCVGIEDAGPGVAPEEVDALFNKFSQGTGLAGKTGLGLYFCRITIEDWGGTIGYETSPQGGARFWFCLPRPPEA